MVYSMDRESKASKMFILSFSVLGNQKQVQDKSINGHVTGVTHTKKILLAHKDNSTLQKLSIESEIIMQMRQVKSLFGSQN